MLYAMLAAAPLLFALSAAEGSDWKLLTSGSPSVDTLWSNFLSEYGVHALDNPSNEQMLTATAASYDTLTQRKAIFSDTVDYISAHNKKFSAGETTYRLGLNQFADLTASELAFYTSPKIGRPDDAAEISPSKLNEILSAPQGNKVDWRTDDLDIHNQGSCGSCWAFATSAMVENRIYQATGDQIEIASQEMVDCVSSCWGCQGGYSYYATEYIEENGVAAEEDYAYQGKTQNCYSSNADRMLSAGDIVAEYTTASGESDMASIVANGAMTIAIDVVYDFFYLKDGVFEPSSCSRWSSDYVGAHAISAVGYTNNYWIIQNSWGSSWGDSGYGYISKGSNICNIGTWDNWSWISLNSYSSTRGSGDQKSVESSTKDQTTKKTNNKSKKEKSNKANQNKASAAASSGAEEAPGGGSSSSSGGFLSTPTLVTVVILASVASLMAGGYYYKYGRRRSAYKEFNGSQNSQPDYGASRTEVSEIQI